jgi:hypothetical protein
MIFALQYKAGPGFSPWEGGSGHFHAKKLGVRGVIVEERIKRSNENPLTIMLFCWVEAQKCISTLCYTAMTVLIQVTP